MQMLQELETFELAGGSQRVNIHISFCIKKNNIFSPDLQFS